MNKKATPCLFLCSPRAHVKGKMQVTRLVVNFNHAVFVFIGVSLSSALFVASVGGNAAALEKVNYNIKLLPFNIS